MPDTTQFLATPPTLNDRQESGKEQVDARGARFVNSTIRHAVAVTVGEAIPGGPCDYLYFSASGDAEIQFAEDGDDETVTIPVPSNEWVPIAAVEVVTVASGDVWAGWIRRPAT